jgi:hypothetical protein
MFCLKLLTNVRTCEISSSHAVIMEAARTSETSVDIQLRTRQYIPEDSELQMSEPLVICRLGYYLNVMFAHKPN